MKNQYLIKKKKVNIFQRISQFISKLFISKKQNDEEYNKKEILNIDNTFNIQFENSRNILEFQRKFECGELKEDDMTEEEKNNLIKLYKEQIETLENNIEMHKKNLARYKEKIIIAKNKK